MNHWSLKRILLLSIVAALASLKATGLDPRVGVAALQGGSADMPEYVRIFQLNQSRATIQWASIEREPGQYDFSIMDAKLAEIQEMGRFAIIKLNANDKPDWLFDIVPFTEKQLSSAIDDPQGTLMYWHPNFVEAYENLLVAFGEYLKHTPYREIISGIRMNLNALGVEQTKVPSGSQALSNWIIPAGVDPETVVKYTDDIPDWYKDIVVGLHIEHILPQAFVWIRTNTPDSTIEKFRDYFEEGQLGFFHTGAGMEQNQVYFNDVHRYARFIEFCRTGKTMGFTEVDGYHIYTGKYDNDPEKVFQMTRFNYWRLLSEMHCGVSMAGTHLHMFQGQLEEGGPTVSFFDVPEMDAGWRFADRYLGLHASPHLAPGAWVALRDDHGDQYAGDYTYLMEREGNNPTPPLEDSFPGVDDGSVGYRKVGSEDVRFGAWARGLPSGKRMIFHVDPRVFQDGEQAIARVVYFDREASTWQLQQGNSIVMSANGQGSGFWQEIEEPVQIDGSAFEIVNTGPSQVIFHMLEIKRDPATWAGYEIDLTGWADTNGFLGWLYVDKAPWNWSAAMNQWLYMPEESLSNEGSWFYVLK